MPGKKERVAYVKAFISGILGRMVELHDRFLPPREKKIKLPWGGLWLARQDYLGQCLVLGIGYEKKEQDFLLQFIQDGWTVLDIGAHHGFYTILAAHKAGPHGRVISFEPSERERSRLRAHLDLNRSSNVTIEEFALGEQEGQETLYVCGGIDTGCNSLRPPKVMSKSQPVHVPIQVLDYYLKEHSINRVDFIKMDVEGGEWNVLKGAGQLLTRKPRPVILLELSDMRSAPWNYRCSELRDFLEKYGYSLFSFEKRGKLLPTPNQEEYNENVLAVPSERHPEIQSYLA